MSKSKLHDKIIANINPATVLRKVLEDAKVPVDEASVQAAEAACAEPVPVSDVAIPTVIRPEPPTVTLHTYYCPTMPEFSKLRPAGEQVFCPHCGFEMVTDKPKG